MTATRIAARHFVRAEPTDDGRALKLVFVDDTGATLALSLPLPCLGALLAALPRRPAPPPGTVDEVLAWQLDAAGATPDGLTLTLQTPEGRTASFRVTSGQIAGMATLAVHGQRSTANRTLN